MFEETVLFMVEKLVGCAVCTGPVIFVLSLDMCIQTSDSCGLSDLAKC